MLFLQAVNDKLIKIIKVNIQSKDYDYLHKVISALNTLCPNCEITLTATSIVRRYYSSLEVIDLTKEVKDRIQ